MLPPVAPGDEVTVVYGELVAGLDAVEELGRMLAAGAQDVRCNGGDDDATPGGPAGGEGNPGAEQGVGVGDVTVDRDSDAVIPSRPGGRGQDEGDVSAGFGGRQHPRDGGLGVDDQVSQALRVIVTEVARRAPEVLVVAGIGFLAADESPGPGRECPELRLRAAREAEPVQGGKRVALRDVKPRERVAAAAGLDRVDDLRQLAAGVQPPV